MGFSSWPGTWSSQASLGGVGEHRPTPWHNVPLAGLSFPTSQFFCLVLPMLLARSPSPPSSSSPAANTPLSSPTAPGGIALTPCGLGGVWLWDTQSPPGMPWLVLRGWDQAPPLLVFVIKSTSCAGRGWEGGEAVGCSKRDLCWKCQTSKIDLASISTKPCPLTCGALPFQREQRRDLAFCPFSWPLIRFVLQLTFHRKAWK